MSANSLLPPVTEYVQARVVEFDEIPSDRRAVLDSFAKDLRSQLAAGKPVRLTFICTHNSRRSHFGQVWAAVAAWHYGVDGVSTFSGGTEATACNPRSVAALRRAGIDIAAAADEPNPHYTVRYADTAPALVCFSKVYDAPENPQTDFFAVMTCTEADQNCPLIHGALARISLPYKDPKAFDGTSEEADRYDERSRQIAREMLYVFSNVAGTLTTPR
ncbi:low molecular weight phosphatase family protein [Planctomicrobium piriforme]|uniref:protein-tyrosine-phosphatase n=1 Tax=Planctomicrobium piriforme TaxID=1576369 RepID=UPI001C31D831|nr:protein-tyrosine-phosphatase [Planctomicrobium piriforme]